MIATRNQNLILVVDDTPEVLTMVNTVLEKADMSCLVALEGKQAIRIAEQMQPDLILLDAMMPGMDGFETCASLKSNNDLHPIPVVFMTGLSDTESIVKAFEVGGIDYVTKPINPVELILRIKVHLNTAQATRSAQTALDNAGQNLCAFTLDGQVKWATPQVTELLNDINFELWQDQTFLEIMQVWLNEPRQKEDELHDDCLGNLHFKYIGQSTLDEHLLQVLHSDQKSEIDLLKLHYGLTQREGEVLLWVAKGKTNREIAEILGLSPRTINKHLEQFFPKLGVENRTAAAARAVQVLQRPN